MDFPPQITAPLASCPSPLLPSQARVPFPDKEDQEENSSYQVVAKMPGQDFGRNVAVLSEPAGRSPLSKFKGPLAVLEEI